MKVCEQCFTDIPEGADVLWNNGSFHASCVTEAVQNRNIQDLGDADGFEELIDDLERDQPRREVHINDVVASATQQFISGRSSNGHGTLMAAKDTRFVPRTFLATIPRPEATDTFKPIHHADLINEITDSLWYRRMNVVGEEYAVSTDGMKMFGLLELDIEYKGVRFAIGVRNAYDRSMRVGIVAGYKVTV